MAIPKCYFDTMLRAVRTQQKDEYRAVSVNQRVQEALNHNVMFDYLLELQSSKCIDIGGEEVYKRYLIGDPRLKEASDLSFALKKVRVTESQFEMLRSRQAQYACDGYRIPISCIVSAMLWQWDGTIRDLFRGKHVDEIPIAWMYSDDERIRVRATWREFNADPGERFARVDEIWLKRDRDEASPNIIVGWGP